MGKEIPQASLAQLSQKRGAVEDDARGCVRTRHLVPNKPDSVLADGPRERAVGEREGLRAPAEPWRALSLCIHSLPSLKGQTTWAQKLNLEEKRALQP